MHTSVTLSEIVSSTFTSNADEINDIELKKNKFVNKIGIGLIEFIFSSLYQCYGLILAQYVNIEGYSLRTAAWTTFIYLAAWNFTAPWSKFLIQHMERRNCYPYKILIGICTFFVAFGINFAPHFIYYGIFAGAFTNVVYIHLNHVVKMKYKSRDRSFEANIQSARAISLLIMPHVVLFLIQYYQIDRATIIYGAIILNVIPASLLLRFPSRQSDPVLDRYQTLPAFSQQMKEMKVFANSPNTSDIKHSQEHLSAEDNSEESTSDEDEGEYENTEETDDLILKEENTIFPEKCKEIYLPPAPLTPTTVQLYYHHAGVSILPKIPEEVDELEETPNINVIDSKRLNRISGVLEELNKSERKESIKELIISTEIVIRPEPILNIEYIPNYSDNNNTFLKDHNFNCCCLPYNLFLWKRRMRIWKDFLMDYLLMPTFRAFTNLHFYPILFSKISLAVSSNFVITLTPYATLQKNRDFKIGDLAFLLSYIAFAWCMSLVLLPLLTKFSPTRLRATFIVGLILSSCSMLLFTKKQMSNEFIIWTCLLFGFGYGLLKFCDKFVYRSFAGKRAYIQMKSILDNLSGFFVILIYYIFYFNIYNLVTFFPLFTAVCYFINAILWIIVPIFKTVLIFMKEFFRNKSDSSSFL